MVVGALNRYLNSFGYSAHMDSNFRTWLSTRKGLSSRVVSNVASRLKRGSLLVGPEYITSVKQFSSKVEGNPDWARIPSSSRTGIVGAVRLYEEFLIQK